MALAPQSRLGPYEILGLLGAGGMGEVYKARDTRLSRVVAIKVLPPKFAADPEFRDRLHHEARAISALDHPHICALYDIGEQDGASYLVMQYLEGETLAARLDRGALPVHEALPIAIQVADALDRAHRAGLIHRDLKPANIMLVRRSGPAGGVDAKLLDFGVAKVSPPVPAAAASDLSTAPTTSTPLTSRGGIVGTWQYMAPEVLEGKEADARTDLFSLGCVIHEMLTGKKAFDGATQASVIGAVMRAHPPAVSSIQPAAPPALDRAVLKCLAKDPDRRWQTAYDLLDELKWIAEAGTAGTAATHEAASPRARKQAAIAWSIATVFLLTTIGLAAALYFKRPPVDTRVFRSTFVPPTSPAGPTFGRLAISPDGRRLAFVAPGPDGRVLLWVRALDGLGAQPLAGTEGGVAPFWSPDSRTIAFVGDGKLKKIDASGGQVQTLTGPAAPFPGSWNDDDVILFAGSAPAGAGPVGPGGPILRVSAAGGTPAPATALDAATGETAHAAPSFLPDGRHFVFMAISGQRSATFVGSLDSTGERTKLLDGLTNTAYADGHLLFVRGGMLMAQPFDANRRALSGEAVPLAEQIMVGPGAQVLLGAFTASHTGVLAYQASVTNVESQLVWFDRAGKQIGTLGDRAPYGTEVNLSPDGSQAVVSVMQSSSNYDVWVFDVARGLRTKLTFDSTIERMPVWSADGSNVVFASNRKNVFDLYQKAANGTGSEELLLADSYNKYPEVFSPDGRFLAYYVFTQTAAANINDIWVLPLFGDRKPFALTQTLFTEYRAQFAPDGRWVAYASNESGRFEVYVMAFPGPGGKRQVSTSGGTDPRWRRDGREIFYLTDNNRLMTAAVTVAGDRFDVGEVRPLFDVKPPGGGRAVYDVARDGQRFLVNTVSEAPVAPLTIVVNWPQLVKQ